MRITFRIHYMTQWGEELFLMLGNDQYASLKMNYSDTGIWSVSLNVSENTRQLRYRYLVKTNCVVTRVERCECHVLSLPTGVNHCFVKDHWDDSDGLSSDLVSRLLNENKEECASSSMQGGKITIEASYPNNKRTKLAIVGDAPVLGSWEPRHAVMMSSCGGSLWRAVLDIPDNQIPAQFKLIAVSKGGNGHLIWENGENRWLTISPGKDGAVLVPGLSFRHAGSVKARIATWVNVADLRSDRDLGAGDLGDLKKLLQWVSATGQDTIVLGSLSDTRVAEGWMPDDIRKVVLDNAIDPLVICPNDTGTLTDKKLKAQYQRRGMELNQQEDLDINKVRMLKLDYCRAVFEQSGPSVKRSATYRRFINENAVWLRPYAAQILLQHINDDSDFSKWGIYSNYDTAQVEKFLKARLQEFSFICFMQYQLRQQLVAAVSFAEKKKLTLSCEMNSQRYVKQLDVKEPWVNQRFIEQRLRESSGLVLIPLRDWLLIDGSFVPRVAQAVSSRLPVTLEELVASHDLTERIKTLIINR